MKKLKYILSIQLTVCIILTLITFLNAYAIVQRVPRIHAYERLLKKDSNKLAGENEIFGFTPIRFSEFASWVANDALDSSSYLVLAFFSASIISLIELFILSNLIKKADIKIASCN